MNEEGKTRDTDEKSSENNKVKDDTMSMRAGGRYRV